mmetsp:Transcript_3233/g.10099  ORF Transcript_3233/g.10099 Transcript_3233/m.10099 type:complete len:339 (-) Transcript_3233:5127-6143(-)
MICCRSSSPTYMRPCDTGGPRVGGCSGEGSPPAPRPRDELSARLRMGGNTTRRPPPPSARGSSAAPPNCFGGPAGGRWRLDGGPRPRLTPPWPATAAATTAAVAPDPPGTRDAGPASRCRPTAAVRRGTPSSSLSDASSGGPCGTAAGGPVAASSPLPLSDRPPRIPRRLRDPRGGPAERSFTVVVSERPRVPAPASAEASGAAAPLVVPKRAACSSLRSRSSLRRFSLCLAISVWEVKVRDFLNMSGNRMLGGIMNSDATMAVVTRADTRVGSLPNSMALMDTEVIASAKSTNMRWGRVIWTWERIDGATTEPIVCSSRSCAVKNSRTRQKKRRTRP